MTVLAGMRRRITAAAPAADLLEFILPQRCPACGVPADPVRILCRACIAEIPRAALDLCCRCLVAERDPAGCTRHAGFRVRAAWLYDERAAAMIAAFKYDGRPETAGFMAGALAEVAGTAPADLVIGVPMHPARRRERGFDHSGTLARAFADRVGVPALDGLLVRTRHVAPQAQRGPRERRAAVRGSMAVAHPDWVRGRRIVVVDDVITTGATLEASLAALGEAGAQPMGLALAWAQ